MGDNKLHIDRKKRAINKIKLYLADRDFTDLKTDDLLYDALLMELLLIGEEASKVSDEFKESHGDIPWHKMIGMRNRITHGYFHVDPKVVWDTCRADLVDLEKQLGGLG